MKAVLWILARLDFIWAGFLVVLVVARLIYLGVEGTPE